MAHIILTKLALNSYVILSPFLFLWFHKKILKQKWDNDLTDWVTALIYIFSNIMVSMLDYAIELNQDLYF